MIKRRAIGVIVLWCIMVIDVFCQNPITLYPVSQNLLSYKDSLNKVGSDIPKKGKEKAGFVHSIKSQEEWNQLPLFLRKCLESGERNITIRVNAKTLMMDEVSILLENLDYQDANIQIVGKHTKMFSGGKDFSTNDSTAKKRDGFYIFPYKGFSINDIVLNKNDKELPLYGKMLTTSQAIEEVESEEGVWRFPVDMPNISSTDCRDFYILLTRDWTACRHQVVRVEDGYLYFVLKSSDAPTVSQQNMNPNKDWITYHKRPRYKLINYPLSDGIHFFKDSVYIPINDKFVHISKEGRMLNFRNCRFHSFTIRDFNIIGGGEDVLTFNKCSFVDGAWIQNNSFSNLSGCAISIRNCENVRIAGNKITNTRVGAIACYGKNNIVMHNTLKNIGWMLNTRAIVGGGEQLHICDNVIEDFNYGAIACGSTLPNEKAPKLTYVIERNLIRYSEKYAAEYMDNTLADAGAIYIGPQCTWGIIRHNVIYDYVGIGANRGIYLDDGAKNLAVYGNLVKNIANSYDIDLRFCKTYAEGIPDHNTNNYIFHNILTGGYRFQDTGLDNSYCLGGQNLLLGIGDSQKTVVKIQKHFSDYNLKGCFYKNNKIIIPKRYANLLDSVCVDSFVRSNLVLQ